MATPWLRSALVFWFLRSGPLSYPPDWFEMTFSLYRKEKGPFLLKDGGYSASVSAL